VWQDFGVVVDRRQAKPGRGAYLHRNLECLSQALRRRTVGRALRVTTVDNEQLTKGVVPHLRPPEPSAIWTNAYGKA
jgi:predicted RNA-binding protein YlxR (DUF448 family)